MALTNPDQPATLRRRTRRERRRRPAGRGGDPARARSRHAGKRQAWRAGAAVSGAGSTAPARPRLEARATASTRAASTASGAATAVRPGLTDHWASVRTGTSAWIRLRSGVILLTLLVIVGALLATAVAGIALLLALAIRSAVG